MSQRRVPFLLDDLAAALRHRLAEVLDHLRGEGRRGLGIKPPLAGAATTRIIIVVRAARAACVVHGVRKSACVPGPNPESMESETTLATSLPSSPPCSSGADESSSLASE